MNSMIKTEEVMPDEMMIQGDNAIKLAAAVLDKRIMTARQFPRSIARFKQEAIELLQQDVETARAAEYSKPVGNGVVRGPSIRLAEIVVMCWTNVDIEIAEPIVTDKSVTVQAFCWDMQRNIRVPGISTASIIDKNGRRYPQHLIETTVLAVASKARRNAVQAAVPRAYINDLLDAARAVANKHQEPLEQIRTKMLDTFAKVYRVSATQVFKHLDVAGIEDIRAEHIDELRAVFNAIKEGEPVDAFFGEEKSAVEIAREKVAARSAKSAKNMPLQKDPPPALSYPLVANPCPADPSEPFADFWKKMAAINEDQPLRAWSDRVAETPALNREEKQLLWDEITRRAGG